MVTQVGKILTNFFDFQKNLFNLKYYVSFVYLSICPGSRQKQKYSKKDYSLKIYSISYLRVCNGLDKLGVDAYEEPRTNEKGVCYTYILE